MRGGSGTEERAHLDGRELLLSGNLELAHLLTLRGRVLELCHQHSSCLLVLQLLEESARLLARELCVELRGAARDPEPNGGSNDSEPLK